MSNPFLDVMRYNSIPADKNPLDVSTVISIYPKEIKERKITLFPSDYTIPAGSMEKFGILHLRTASWWKQINESDPPQLLEVPVSSVVVAHDLINDWCKGLLAVDLANAMPGLFWLPGNLTADQVRKEHQAELANADRKQKNYYQALVRMADTMWSRTNGNPLAINDEMRLSARSLGMNDKEWLADYQAVQMVRCVACGNMRNPLYPICPTCKAVVDKDKAKALNLVFAEG